jgi:transposase
MPTRSTAKASAARGRAKGRTATSVPVLHPNAAGIDIGSGSHFVAVAADRASQPVREFGCFTPDLYAMADWLEACGVETVAMESTGVYWLPAFQILEQRGFEVRLVNARHVKNVPGRKSDVLDCQWIQQLHAYGLLEGSFRPSDEVCVMRALWRQRETLVQARSKQVQHMQKAMIQMNLQLHKVVTDITGVTGMTIICAILQGERDGLTLAKLKHPNARSSEQTIAKALTGDWRPEHLFCLRQAVEAYDFYAAQIAACDLQLEAHMKTLECHEPAPLQTRRRKGRPRPYQPQFDQVGSLQRIAGVDLTRIDGIEAVTAQTVLSEVGWDLSRFPTEKHFCSWLGLCPDNRITGGKIVRTGTRKVKNRAAAALRMAAQSLHRSQSALGAYYRRMRARLGAPKAITATANKLARIIYRMLTKGEQYVDQGAQSYEQKYRARAVENLKRQANRLGLQIIENPRE